MKAYIIPQDGTAIRPTEIGENSLSTLQGLVGGYIQALPMTSGFDFIINEEGKFDSNCEVNVSATLIAGILGRLFPGDYIVGDVVITGTPGSDGEMTEPDHRWMAIANHLDIPVQEEAATR